MYGAIWPDPNVRFVLQYHANVNNPNFLPAPPAAGNPQLSYVGLG
jgi:hypothetical protein